ncbi:MAG: hypothetical protein OCC45_13285 [Desulfotalea sp.]
MELSERFKIVTNHYNHLEKSSKNLRTEIAKLTQSGCINAREYWKDDKYLYLLYPMKNGKRKKVYYGNHAPKIKVARQKISNYKKRSELVETLLKLDESIQDLERLSEDLLFLCSKGDLSSLAAYNELNLGTDNFQISASADKFCTQ